MQETKQDLVEQAEAKPRPLLAFRDALRIVEREHEKFIDMKKKLVEAQTSLEEAKRATASAYFAAVEAAANIGERLPEIFRLGDLELQFEPEGYVKLEHKPAAETWELINLAKKAGEQE
ncbi:hypothetical protein [Azotobacter vinelandii]